MTVIDGRIYVDGRRCDYPPDMRGATDRREQSGGVAWIGLMNPDRTIPRPRRTGSGCTRWPSRTRTKGISARSSNSTATRCSSCCARPGTAPTTRCKMQNRLRNVLDHAIRVMERVDGARALLENALTVHSTLVSLDQNEAMRRMSSASLAQGEESRRLAEQTIEQGEQVSR
ncbi:hypothetical protein ACIQRW_24300 [Streptomyces sp. NPDC091287]|uniref:hypothetical protein n=1 Tax=Streptomyces sp. NPDC091287 TaxID=3365988 RepID=UPI00380758AE